MRTPSIKSLLTLGATVEEATLAKRLLLKQVKTTDRALFPESNSIFDKFFRFPDYVTRLFYCLNECLRFHGVEYIGKALYLNAGETYASTLFFDGKSVFVSTFGDYVERRKL